MRSLRTAVRLRGVISSMLIVTAAGLTGCQTDPDGSDRFVAKDPGFANQGFGTGVAVYFSNRLFDLLDIVHGGIGLGPGLGAELHLTRYMRIGAGCGIDGGVGWFGRMGNPFQSGHYARAAFSVYDAQETVPGDIRWRFPRWDIGVFVHLYLQEGYLAIAIDELPDFLCGLIAYDLKDDDFGRDSLRATRLVSSGGVEDSQPKQPGH